MNSFIGLVRMCLVLTVVAMTFVGCAWTYPGFQSGSLFHSGEEGRILNSGVTRYEFRVTDFEVLGTVEVELGSWGVLGLAAVGENGLGRLREEARRKFNADDVVNISVDEKEMRILGFVFSTRTTILRGTAVKWNLSSRK